MQIITRIVSDYFLREKLISTLKILVYDFFKKILMGKEFFLTFLRFYYMSYAKNTNFFING